MPSSIIISNSTVPDKPTHKAAGIFTGGTFTGDVYANTIHVSNDPSIVVAKMTFCPCARTNWHTHVGGGVVHVLHGSGWICDKGEEARKVKTGDTVWVQPGTTHWHGAEEESIITGFAIAFGETKWLEEVTDEEYGRAKKSNA